MQRNNFNFKNQNVYVGIDVHKQNWQVSISIASGYEENYRMSSGNISELVTHLRNKYPEVEADLLATGEPIILTKNGYGSMVILTIDQFARLTDEVELKLNEADMIAENSQIRFTGEEAFAKARAALNE